MTTSNIIIKASKQNTFEQGDIVKHIKNDIFILVDAYNALWPTCFKGVTINKSEFYNIGVHRDTWANELFDVFEGTITLESKKD